QSEHAFSACGMPVLAPAGLQDYLDLGLHGWAMSRYSGCWVAMKLTADSVESSATVLLDPQRVQISLPEDFILPPDGLHIRWPDPQLAQEQRMQEFKVYAALAYARSNRLNHLVFGSNQPARLGIVACGKAYLDVRQALDDLGIDESLAGAIGLRLYKVGMPWPLEAEGVRHFADGLEEILVVEEKRQIIEYQLKEQLYNWQGVHGDVRPRVVGKFDEGGEWSATQRPWLLPPTGELTPAIVARAIAARIGRFHTSEKIRQRLAVLEAKDRAPATPLVTAARKPYFCSGCPHNSSTKVPEGSAALGGVGCHLMAVTMDRNTLTICQMGGEGAAWLGIAEHSGTRHIFANLGDGTYYHSGILAIRAAVAAGVNITYKILYNDAVAMTGGQPFDGPLDVPQITRQLAAEGVPRIVVLADDPHKYPSHAEFASGVEIFPRDDLDRVQRELRDTPGVSALIYDQTCAAEKRRRRKRGDFPDPDQRIFINQLVCEGCGDCSARSNCLSVVPVETEFGSKRAIDQSSCNKDYSCAAGFCPSFVSVSGGRVRRVSSGEALNSHGDDVAGLPEPVLPDLASPYGILIAGVGGTGVVTIGALIGMAAHIEGKGVTVLDMAGLAQKGGSVFSHVRLAQRQEQLHAARIATGEANTVLGCDILVAVSEDALSKAQPGFSRAIVNTGRSITGDFVRNPDQVFPLDAMEDQMRATIGPDAAEFLNATRLATMLMGNSIMTNMFMLGYAWQQGQVPVSSAALMEAIALNGVSIAENTSAFVWGRRAALDLPAIEAMVRAAAPVLPTHRLSQSADEVIARRRDFLIGYQDAAYAQRYIDLVGRVRQSEAAILPGSTALTEAMARNYFKLLAYKDEYEVARLFSGTEFESALHSAFEGDYRLTFHLAPPIFNRPDQDSGDPKKRSFGPWMMPVFHLLARLRFLRGTPFDVFGYAAERRMERQLIAEYEESVELLLGVLAPENRALILEIACLPEMVRGYGPVKSRNVEAYRARRQALMTALAAPPPVVAT
ncbi:MAG: indolepyruvate ferredoxin oxidoreductase family protein, partial [Sterolibacterium sp.]